MATNEATAVLSEVSAIQEKIEASFDEVGDGFENADDGIVNQLKRWSSVIESREAKSYAELGDCRAQNSKLISHGEVYANLLQQYHTQTIAMIRSVQHGSNPTKGTHYIRRLAVCLARLKTITTVSIPESHIPQYIRTHFPEEEGLGQDNDVHAYVYIGKWRIKREVNSTRMLRSTYSQEHDNLLLAPRGLAIDPVTKNVFVCDTGHHRISIFKPDFRPLDTVPAPLPPRHLSSRHIPRFLSIFSKKKHDSSDDEEEPQYTPYFVAFSPKGDFYGVIDREAGYVYVYNRSNRVVTVFGGRHAKYGPFQSPSSLVFDKENYIYVADTGNERIAVFHPSQGYIRSMPCPKLENSPRTPFGLSISQNDELYVTYQGSEFVHVFDLAGNVKRKYDVEYSSGSIVGVLGENHFYLSDLWSKVSVYNKDGMLKKRLLVERVGGALFNQNGELLISELDNDRVTSHEIAWGIDSIEFPRRRAVGSTGKTIQFRNPKGMCIHPITEEIYIADYDSGMVLILSPELSYIGKIVLPSEYMPGTTHGYAIQPVDVAISSDGSTILVAEASRGLIYMLDRQHNVLRIIRGGQDDGLPGMAGIQCITFDNQDNIYVADHANKLIRKYDKTGKYLCLVGDGDGRHVHSPHGITVNDANELVVSYSTAPLVAIFSTLTGALINNYHLGFVGQNYITRGPGGGFVICNRYSRGSKVAGRVLICSPDARIVKSFEVNSPAGAAFNRHGGLIVVSQTNQMVYEF
eukprot:TRINITY_DN20043_c0_g1_i1.p1 TRINITY_DN20043_c0_g1~~TRINITY_DN20043_c0_g1_i1.p1  ORF type:complete len:746 (+),score=95.05 TRINITY_DN20043_c0_g1_i1:36-2273(+)